MTIPWRKLSFWDYFAVTGIVCFITGFGLPLIGTALELALNSAVGVREFAIRVALGLFAAFSLVAFVLWVRSLFRLFQRWGQRKPQTNVGLLVCVLMPVFGAFAFHFIDRGYESETA
jgi:hypothetical protein